LWMQRSRQLSLPIDPTPAQAKHSRLHLQTTFRTSSENSDRTSRLDHRARRLSRRALHDVSTTLQSASCAIRVSIVLHANEIGLVIGRPAGDVGPGEGPKKASMLLSFSLCVWARMSAAPMLFRGSGCSGPSKLGPTPDGNELARTPRYVAEHGGQIFGKPRLPHPRAAYRLGGTRKQKILKFQGRDI
jgi:hypothetical protein